MNNTVELSTLRQQRDMPREATLPAVAPGFGSLQSFELMQRAAKLLSNSTLVPTAYRAWDEKKKAENPHALANCVVALNMAQRVGADPLMVMQNLYIVEDRPSWSAQWVISALNGCGRFSPLRFDIQDLGEKEVEYETTKWVNGDRVVSKNKAIVRNLECVAWAAEKETGKRITSPAVSIEMAVKEGWYGKQGSKWKTMPEVMLRYRTASFFGRIYAPEFLMGLQTVEELQDVIEARKGEGGVYVADLEQLKVGEPSNKDEAEEVADGAAQEKPETVEAETIEAIEDVEAIEARREAEKAKAAAPRPKRTLDRPANAPDEWTPSPEERAAIHAREMAEAAEDSSQDNRTAPRRPQRERRDGLNLE
jgi:hypothetical protein